MVPTNAKDLVVKSFSGNSIDSVSDEMRDFLVTTDVKNYKVVSKDIKFANNQWHIFIWLDWND